MKDYTVLARKYRPQNFSQVVGQEHVIDAMKNSIVNNKLHSVYLLSGTRGVGKTTIARIFTKAMSCVNFTQNLECCGHCQSCLAIDENSSTDLIEIDAASKTKVEDTRELIETLAYPPLISSYKVFIIDEVHMLSTSSFNALLKTLEEPPEYVKFILCTTDPQKIPATVLSRCLHFHLKPLTEEQIAGQLASILSQEGINYEQRAVQVLAKAANGSMRDCLSLADQAIALGNRQVTTEKVYQMIGLISDELPTTLVINLLNANYQQAVECFEEIAKQQTDWSGVINQILEVLFQLSIAPFISPNDYKKYNITNELLLNYLKQPQISQNTYLIKIQLLIEIFQQSLRQLSFSANPKQIIHLAIIRALAFRPSDVINIDVINSLPSSTTPTITPIYQSSGYIDYNQNTVGIPVVSNSNYDRAIANEQASIQHNTSNREDILYNQISSIVDNNLDNNLEKTNDQTQTLTKSVTNLQSVYQQENNLVENLNTVEPTIESNVESITKTTIEPNVESITEYTTDSVESTIKSVEIDNNDYQNNDNQNLNDLDPQTEIQYQTQSDQINNQISDQINNQNDNSNDSEVVKDIQQNTIQQEPEVVDYQLDIQKEFAWQPDNRYQDQSFFEFYNNDSNYLDKSKTRIEFQKLKDKSTLNQLVCNYLVEHWEKFHASPDSNHVYVNIYKYLETVNNNLNKLTNYEFFEQVLLKNDLALSCYAFEFAIDQQNKIIHYQDPQANIALDSAGIFVEKQLELVTKLEQVIKQNYDFGIESHDAGIGLPSNHFSLKRTLENYLHSVYLQMVELVKEQARNAYLLAFSKD